MEKTIAETDPTKTRPITAVLVLVVRMNSIAFRTGNSDDTNAYRGVGCATEKSIVAAAKTNQSNYAAVVHCRRATTGSSVALMVIAYTPPGFAITITIVWMEAMSRLIALTIRAVRRISNAPVIVAYRNRGFAMDTTIAATTVTNAIVVRLRVEMLRVDEAVPPRSRRLAIMNDSDAITVNVLT